MAGYCAFPKAPVLGVLGGSYPSEEMQSVFEFRKCGIRSLLLISRSLRCEVEVPVMNLSMIQIEQFNLLLAHLTGAAEYTDCISAERQDTLSVYPGYDTKQSYGEPSIML